MQTWILEWSAVAIGLIGTLAWALKNSLSPYCGLIWIAGSILWVWFAILQGHYGLALNNIIYIIIYSYGSWKWIKNKPMCPVPILVNQSNLTNKDSHDPI